MLIQVDWYRYTGKWAYGTRVEVDAEAWNNKKIVTEIIKNQGEITKDWWISKDMYMVLNDIPESWKDPNYRMTYARLYTPEQIFQLAEGY